MYLFTTTNDNDDDHLITSSFAWLMSVSDIILYDNNDFFSFFLSFFFLPFFPASSFTCIPFIVYSRLEHKSEATGEHVYCVNQWPSPTWLKAVTVAFVMSTYVIPLLVIIVCYTLILKHLWQSKIGIRREIVCAHIDYLGNGYPSSKKFSNAQCSPSVCLSVCLSV